MPGPFSPAARAVADEAGQLPLVVLHGLKLANAFERMVVRGLIARWERRAVPWRRSGHIEAPRSTRVSLDRPHVAAAHQVRSKEFVSSDDRRLAVAKASGLAIVNIKDPFRKRPG